MRGDGDGWVTCAQRHDHWGVHGAAGLLLRDRGRILLQHRATWSHHGGTWGLLGGARDSGEWPHQTALREAAEEGEIEPDAVALRATYVDDHGGWSYTTVLADVPATFRRPLDLHPRVESIELAWIEPIAVPALQLHPGFAATWAILAEAPSRLHLVVDAANVVGSRADGWWRDRMGATARLRDQLVGLAATSVLADLLKVGSAPRFDRWWPIVHLVTEGDGTRIDDAEQVQVIRSPADGDDTVVSTAANLDGQVVVITADRELRDRCLAVGAQVRGPRWLMALL